MNQGELAEAKLSLFQDEPTSFMEYPTKTRKKNLL